jgi:hypothetical protein
MGDIITFKSFYNIEPAIEFSVLLKNNGVENRLITPRFYNQRTPDPLLQEFHVQIDEDDFIKANNILENIR